MFIDEPRIVDSDNKRSHSISFVQIGRFLSFDKMRYVKAFLTSLSAENCHYILLDLKCF